VGRLIVQKYGGTSVGSPERILGVAQRVKGYVEKGDKVVVVVSAMSGETNRLVALGEEIWGPQFNHRELDVLYSSGEQASIALVSLALEKVGVTAKSFLADQIPLRTNGEFGKARIVEIESKSLKEAIADGIVPVVAGFQGVTADGLITTLGRGGSDTSAVAVAAALDADECEICTDVDGVYTADPRIIKKANRLDQITFEEMLELASLGSKVLHPRSVELAGRHKVPLRVVSTFEGGQGTLISFDGDDMEGAVVSGIAHAADEAKITIEGVADIPGVASKIISPVSAANIDVDMIVQNTSADGLTDFTFTVKRPDFDEALALLGTVSEEIGARKVSGDPQISKVSVVGVGMRSHAGVASRVFEALAKESINIQMISTSEIKISVVVDEKYTELAVRSLHEEFNL
tara:strand:+ start:1464 stop:2678 length:1215 start_codon:yes stop_codon:yes gene_type:complete